MKASQHVAPCPGCGERRKVYRDEKGWRCYCHGHIRPCFDPWRQPRIPDSEVSLDVKPAVP